MSSTYFIFASLSTDFPKGTEWKCEGWKHKIHYCCCCCCCLRCLKCIAFLLPEPLPGTTISIDPDHVRLGKSVNITCSIPTQHQNGTFILDQKDGPFQERKKVRGTSATFTISSVDYKHEGAYRCVYETTGSHGHTVRNHQGQHATLSVDGKYPGHMLLQQLKMQLSVDTLLGNTLF